jgi:oligosaccharide 4-alpha-D-glucosyltransferase
MHVLRYFASLVFLAGFSQHSLALEQHYVSHTLHEQTLNIKTDRGLLQLTFYNADAVEAFYQPDGLAQIASFSIAAAPIATSVHVTETPKHLIFNSADLSVQIEKSPLRIRYLKHGKTVLSEEQGLRIENDRRGFRFNLNAHEKLMGTGQRVLGMDRRGHNLPLYNKASYGYTSRAEQMYFSLPMVLSSNKYLLLFDNAASGNVDLGKTEHDVLEFSAVDGRTAYVVVVGDDTPEIIKNYVLLTGKQPLPPRWAFGNFASRFGYRSEAEARATIAAFKQEDFPVDAIILDLYWFGTDIKGHMGNLAWEKNAFPSPEKMMADFKQQGVKTILVTEPFVLTSSKRWPQAVAAGAITPGLDLSLIHI